MSSILPGLNTVFAVQTVVSGSGRTAATTTSILSFAVSKGTPGTTITPAGTISDIEVKTVGTEHYLYVNTITTSTSQSGGTTATSSTRTLTIYSQTGAVIKTVAL